MNRSERQYETNLRANRQRGHHLATVNLPQLKISSITQRLQNNSATKLLAVITQQQQ